MKRLPWRLLWLLALGQAVWAHDFQLGSLRIDHPYAPPTLAGTDHGAVYFRVIRNTGEVADELVAARSPVAQRVALHQMRLDHGVMRMAEVPALTVPARGEVPMRHGQAEGHHLVLMSLKRPLREGDEFPLTLVFRRQGEREVRVSVHTLKSGNAKASTAHAH